MYLVASVKMCTMMIELSSEQSRSQFYIHTRLLLLLLLFCVLLYCCCCSSIAAVLPFVVVCRQICCSFVESDRSVLFLFI